MDKENIMNLYADIGNTAIDIAFEERGEILSLEKHAIGSDLKNALLPRLNQIENAYISYVNRHGLDNLLNFLKKINYRVLSREKMIEYASKNGYTIDNMDILGSDLFCDIIAEEDPNSQIIVDLGTASKILYTSKEKIFYGSMIFPSPCNFPKALSATTDLLSDYPIQIRSPIISLNTEECISSGATNGIALLIKGAIDQIKEEYKDENPTIYLTGGNRVLVTDALIRYGVTFHERENMVIEGLRRIFSQKGE